MKAVSQSSATAIGSLAGIFGRLTVCRADSTADIVTAPFNQSVGQGNGQALHRINPTKRPGSGNPVDLVVLYRWQVGPEGTVSQTVSQARNQWLYHHDAAVSCICHRFKAYG